MNTLFWNYALFLILTWAYFEYKPRQNTGAELWLYFGFLWIVQTVLNMGWLSATCGGTWTDQAWTACRCTFFPWFFMFGVSLVLLQVFPSLVSVFSNVIGYFYIAKEANTWLNTVLNTIPTRQNEALNAVKDEAAKTSLTAAAELIMELVGNPSVLLNQITPDNVDQYWNRLTPLMKPELLTDTNKQMESKSQLVRFVWSRYNVGLATWYIYMGVLVISVVQMQLASQGCNHNPAVMEQKYKEFTEAEDKAIAEKKARTETTYTLTH